MLLKTVKEIEKYLPEDPYCMMDKLEIPTDNRTLNSKCYRLRKDKYDLFGFIEQSSLRKEAINWVKNRHIKIDSDFCEFLGIIQEDLV